MKIYISGKISGLADFERLFNEAESELLKNGHDVVNPVRLLHDHDKTWQSYMKECLKAMMDCEAIFMLSNWLKSDGAIIERSVAHSLQFKIIYQNYEQVDQY
jgi:hypothetical protein